MNYLTVYREIFSNILPCQFEPEKEENAEDTLDNVGSVPLNNGPRQETNTHELDRITRNNWCLRNKYRKEEREIGCLCCRDVTAIQRANTKVSKISAFKFCSPVLQYIIQKQSGTRS